MRKWNHIGIVGAGTMGGGIAQVAAEAGCQVTLVDASQEALDKHESRLKATMEKLVAKGRRSQGQADSTLSNITRTPDLTALSGADLVVEAIVEAMEAKQKLFQALEQVVSESCVLASNTSSLSVTGVASACQHPERVVGLHFFNPAPSWGWWKSSLRFKPTRHSVDTPWTRCPHGGSFQHLFKTHRGSS